MEQKTLDMPDGLKEENEQEITSNEKCYGSDSGDKSDILYFSCLLVSTVDIGF
jgi:hypothetical protein